MTTARLLLLPAALLACSPALAQAPAAGTGIGGFHGPVSSAQPAGSLGAGISRGPGSGVSAGAFGVNAPARPTFEMPRDPHPSFEVPAFNDVQRYHMHGLGYGQQYRNHYGYNTGYGYGLPFGFDPGFAGYLDGVDTSGDMGSASEAAPPSTGEGQPPERQAGGYAPGARGAYGAQGYAGPAAAGQPSPAPEGSFGQGSMGAPPYAVPLGPSRRAAYDAAGTSGETNSGPVTDGLPHPRVTLIFNDGRPPLQVKSYVLTGATIIAIDGERQLQIPLSDLDLRATQKKNQADGIDFTVPGAPR
jgi:hypothetical protein